MRRAQEETPAPEPRPTVTQLPDGSWVIRERDKDDIGSLP